MSYGIIYKITNTVNGKLYIGQTTKSLEARWRSHLYAAQNCDNRNHFAHGIRKHGKDAFVIEKIAEAQSREELDRLECDFIAACNSMKLGYNCTTGGQKKRRLRQDAKNRLSSGLTASHARKRNALIKRMIQSGLSLDEMFWVLQRRYRKDNPEAEEKMEDAIYDVAHNLNWYPRDYETLDITPEIKEELWQGRHDDPLWNKSEKWIWDGTQFVSETDNMPLQIFTPRPKSFRNFKWRRINKLKAA